MYSLSVMPSNVPKSDTPRNKKMYPICSLILARSVFHNGDMENRIKPIRESRRLSQTQLGEMVGTGRSTIAKLEAGERKLTQEWMERLSRALSCSMTDLLPIDGMLVENPDEQSLIEMYRRLDPSARSEILEIGEIKLRNQNKRS